MAADIPNSADLGDVAREVDGTIEGLDMVNTEVKWSDAYVSGPPTRTRHGSSKPPARSTVFSEKVSGENVDDRAQLKEMLAYVREGHTVRVSRPTGSRAPRPIDSRWSSI